MNQSFSGQEYLSRVKALGLIELVASGGLQREYLGEVTLSCIDFTSGCPADVAGFTLAFPALDMPDMLTV